MMNARRTSRAKKRRLYWTSWIGYLSSDSYTITYYHFTVDSSRTEIPPNCHSPFQLKTSLRILPTVHSTRDLYLKSCSFKVLTISRLLQLFLLAGQTYFQPPDIIDLIVRSTASREPPYPLMTLPKTTERWQRPCPAFAFPKNLDLCDESYKGTLQRAALTHINVIVRSSFHQTRHTTSPQVTAPVVVDKICMYLCICSSEGPH